MLEAMHDLTLDRWQGLSDTDRVATAKKLLAQLPVGFSFGGVHARTLGASTHQVAEFGNGGVTFALVPGGPMTLGFDPERFRPNPEELESWRGSADEYGIEASLTEHLASVTLRPRSVAFAPLLVETSAGEVAWEQLSPDDPAAAEVVRELRDSSSRRLQVHGGDGVVRATSDENGAINVERATRTNHEDLVSRLRRQGYRLLTSDEWELACGAGAPTLFRWGDHAPCDRYPVDFSADPAKRWDLHTRPNAFGIQIASNPYHNEVVAEPGVTRGGDGGGTVCGGAGFFLGWLTLATAYFEEHACRYPPEEPLAPGYTVARRVLPVG